MSKIIEIEDFFVVEGKGIAIGGVNSFFDSLTDDEIKNYIGNEVLVTNPTGLAKKFFVLEVSVSTALSGKKNLFLLLPSESKDLIQVNSEITN